MDQPRISISAVMVLAGYIVLHAAQNTVSAQATFAQARQGFHTKLTQQLNESSPVPEPPKGILEKVSYDAPVGKLAAYLTPDPGDGKKHPAIIWITGGFSNSIDESAWEKAPVENDQSARAFRAAGIVEMYPSLRGGNDNPGSKEVCFGEVDDVLAAAHFLEKQPDVDSKRIYLGGHSTGGTLVLLVAECSDRFRAVFSFGPIALISAYGPGHLPFNVVDQKEITLRSPGLWLRFIHSPVFVFERKKDPSNAVSVSRMAQLSRNPAVQFHLVKGASHFSILAPVTELVAEQIVADDGPAAKFDFVDEDMDSMFVGAPEK
jgi:dienelactone hydrolase